MEKPTFLDVHDASYITVEAAFGAIDPEILKKIEPVGFTETEMETPFHMGILQKTISCDPLKLELKNLNEKGAIGDTFNLTLDQQFATEWAENSTIKSFVNKNCKLILLFQNNQSKINKMDVSFPASAKATITVLKFHSSFEEAGTKPKGYTKIQEICEVLAGTTDKFFCDLYVVVRSVKKGLEGTKTGVYAVADVSIDDKFVKEIILKLSSKDEVNHTIRPGDILRAHVCAYKKKANDQYPEFHASYEDVVFFNNYKPISRKLPFSFAMLDVKNFRELKNVSLAPPPSSEVILSPLKVEASASACKRENEDSPDKTVGPSLSKKANIERMSLTNFFFIYGRRWLGVLASCLNEACSKIEESVGSIPDPSNSIKEFPWKEVVSEQTDSVLTAHFAFQSTTLSVVAGSLGRKGLSDPERKVLVKGAVGGEHWAIVVNFPSLDVFYKLEGLRTPQEMGPDLLLPSIGFVEKEEFALCSKFSSIEISPQTIIQKALNSPVVPYNPIVTNCQLWVRSYLERISPILWKDLNSELPHITGCVPDLNTIPILEECSAEEKTEFTD